MVKLGPFSLAFSSAALSFIALTALAGTPALDLAGTRPLELEGDLSARMVAGIHQFLLKETARSATNRQEYWHPDFSSTAAYDSSLETNRASLRHIIGAMDERIPVKHLEVSGESPWPREPHSGKIGVADSYTASAVRWPVFEGVWGEGVLLQPNTTPKVWVLAIPDADQAPELLSGLVPGLPPERQFARRLAEHGCAVLVPALIDRQDTWSGNSRLNRFTNQPHREWIYRQAYMMGRHIIGYEVQKVLTAVDFIAAQPGFSTGAVKAGVAGYGEGGLLALYSAAVDKRISAALVSGYFDSREQLWQEPIYRNVFGLLETFGDAEIATLIAPRTLVVEHSAPPQIPGPPAPRPGRSGAAPGKITSPDYASVEAEFEKARRLLSGMKGFDGFHLICGPEGMLTGPGSDRALAALLVGLGLGGPVKQPGRGFTNVAADFGIPERQHRQVKELEQYTQNLFWASEDARDEFFWRKNTAKTAGEWQDACRELRRHFRREVIGELPPPSLPANPRSRPLALKGKNWTGYEVVLDVYPDVFAWGCLLVPNDLKSGEKRPVVVCQHGLEGVPENTINDDPAAPGFKYYRAFASRLCDLGFVVFAPHNPYRGGDRFRELQRQANPLKKSLFSIIIAQHERILDWLSGLPFADSRRIGFYGLSYGGKTAMRVPAAVEGYALSICSGDFNEWVRKNLSVDYPGSYMFTGEYEMFEFDLGHTFNYAEMAGLIAPRPFMVERGHDDPVGKDEWVAYEYAKVRRLYDRLGIGDRTQLEFFDGAHMINGKGTFEFLQKYLQKPGQL